MSRAGHTKCCSQLVILSQWDRKDRVEMNHSVSQPRTGLTERSSKARHPPKMGDPPSMAVEPFAKHRIIFANIPEYTHSEANKLSGIEKILHTQCQIP